MEAASPLLERLRQRSWRLTPQRRAVAQVLRGDHVHLTADDVLAAARTEVPEISLATVYNTLNELVAMGEVLEVRVAGGPARYDPNAGVPHHHLVCRSCGAIYDIQPQGVDRLQLSGGDRHGFGTVEVEVTFRGLCPACSPAA